MTVHVPPVFVDPLPVVHTSTSCQPCTDDMISRSRNSSAAIVAPFVTFLTYPYSP